MNIFRTETAGFCADFSGSALPVSACAGVDAGRCTGCVGVCTGAAGADGSGVLAACAGGAAAGSVCMTVAGSASGRRFATLTAVFPTESGSSSRTSSTSQSAYCNLALIFPRSR